MMNYQHSYHVGNSFDVFKHIVLIQLIRFLQKKETGFCYFDTHAAKALYSLNDITAQKTLEYRNGIGALWEKSTFTSCAINDYLQCIKQFNLDGNLAYYPGSGLIASTLLRDHDEGVLCELNPPIYADLAHYFRRNKKIHVHQGNGYQTVFSVLPPKKNRGLVLIDPPYEAADEYKHIILTLEKMHSRFPQGVYAIWFPIKEAKVVSSFYRQLQNLSFNTILAAQLCASREYGSGMIIINPPWQFDAILEKMLPELLSGLTLVEGKIEVKWVKNHG